MTRLTQKVAERRILEGLLSALGIIPEAEIDDKGERPDFLVSISGQTVGIEITMYQSGTRVSPEHTRRQVEAGWESLKAATTTFLLNNQDIKAINVGLMFKDIVPPPAKFQAFIEEIAAFIRSNVGKIKLKDAVRLPLILIRLIRIAIGGSIPHARSPFK